MDVNFELYKVFYQVATSGSFSGGAARLYISQSAVSQSIRTLETRLNCRLFQRSSKNVRLTPEGTVLFRHIEQAFNFIKSGERQLENMQSLQAGEVKIGVTDTICRYILLPVIQQFHASYPEIRLNIINRTSPNCLELLTSGSVDIAVLNLPETPAPPGTSLKPLVPIHDVFIAGQSFAFLKNQSLTLAQIRAYPLLVLEKNTVTRSRFDALLQTHGLDPTPDIELGSLDLLAEMARVGLGISFTIREYIEDILASGAVFTLTLSETPPPRYVGFATHQKVPLSAAARKFIDVLETKDWRPQ